MCLGDLPAIELETAPTVREDPTLLVDDRCGPLCPRPLDWGRRARRCARRTCRIRPPRRGEVDSWTCRIRPPRRGAVVCWAGSQQITILEMTGPRRARVACTASAPPPQLNMSRSWPRSRQRQAGIPSSVPRARRRRITRCQCNPTLRFRPMQTFPPIPAHQPVAPRAALHYVQALYDFHPNDPANDSELTLKRGDVIQLLEQGADGWWEGIHMTSGLRGLFPGTHVQFVS